MARVLLVQKYWLDKILSGEKTWEIRSSNTRVRGKILLGYKNHIYGETNLVNSFKISKEGLGLAENLSKHCIEGPVDHPIVKHYKAAHVWELSGTVRYSTPIEFTRKRGQVVWCLRRDTY